MANEKLIALFQDANFAKEISGTESAEEVLKLIKSKGVETNADEIQAVLAEISKPASGELSDDELDAVAGGLIEIQINPTVIIDPDITISPETTIAPQVIVEVPTPTIPLPSIPGIPEIESPLKKIKELFKK